MSGSLHVCPGFELSWPDPQPTLPDVFMIEVTGGGGKRIPKVKTIYRLPNESDHALWARTLEAATRLAQVPPHQLETVGYIRASRLSVEQAMTLDDARENRRLFIFSCINSDLAEIRVMGASMLIDFYELNKP